MYWACTKKFFPYLSSSTCCCVVIAATSKEWSRLLLSNSLASRVESEGVVWLRLELRVLPLPGNLELSWVAYMLLLNFLVQEEILINRKHIEYNIPMWSCPIKDWNFDIDAYITTRIWKYQYWKFSKENDENY